MSVMNLQIIPGLYDRNPMNKNNGNENIVYHHVGSVDDAYGLVFLCYYHPD